MSQRPSHNANYGYLHAAEALRPNAGQWQAYESSGNCVILAGPGSGKTKTITIKMARILAEDVKPPRGVACLTYSNQCVRELRRRLDALGVEQNRQTVVSTVHAFCLRHVVVPFASLAGLTVPDPIKVGTSAELEACFAEAVKKNVGVDERVESWRTRCDRYRRTFLNRTSNEWRQTDQECVSVITAYESNLLNRGIVDFDGMVLFARQIVREHEWARTALAARFPVLVVDEYQDLGVPLHDIVMSLCIDGNIRLIAVGDPDQSIYGFTGAHPELLGELAEMPSVEKIPLRINYRCRKNIVDASVAALGMARQFEAFDDREGIIDFHHCRSGFDEQMAVVCDKIIPTAQASGYELGKIAVLYPNQYDGSAVAHAVATRSYEYVRADAGNPYPRAMIVTWLEDCAQWCAGGWEQAQPSLSQILAWWMSTNTQIRTDADEVAERAKIAAFLMAWRGPEKPFAEWLGAFRNQIIDAALQDPTRRDEVEALEKLVALCGEGKLLEGASLTVFARRGGSPDHLNLITLHSSKGMEFDVVAMVGLEDGKLPFFSSISSPALLREERRKFYVGLTRARHEVHLLFSGWYRDRFNNVHRDGPSRFLREVRDRLES